MQTRSEVSEFLEEKGYPNLVKEFEEQQVLTMAAFRDLDEDDLVKHMKCSSLVASKLLNMAKNYYITVDKLTIMNHMMEQQKSKFEMELKIKELEMQHLMSDRLNEAKLRAIEEKLLHMEVTNAFKRQIDKEKFKGENAVLAAKLKAEKEKADPCSVVD